MGRTFIRLVLALLCLALLHLPALARAAEAPRFTGTFVQLLADHASWDLARWKAVFASMRAIGVTEVVVQWSVNDATPTYASTHFPTSPSESLPTVLAAAREQGMRLVLGLVHDPAFWAKIDRDPKLVRVYFRRLRNASLAAARELAALAQGNPAFAGFYIPQEIDDRNWLDPDRGKVLVEFLGELTKGLRDIAPDAPVAISGFSNAFAEPGLLRQFWEGLLRQTGIDRVLFQDGIGVAKLRPGETGVFLEAVSQAARATGRMFTPVVETFTQIDGPPLNDKPFRAVPASLERLKRQLAVAGGIPHSGILAFSLPEYCSPFGGPQAAALYTDYQKNFFR
jgi:hypothetical protein